MRCRNANRTRSSKCHPDDLYDGEPTLVGGPWEAVDEAINDAMVAYIWPELVSEEERGFITDRWEAVFGRPPSARGAMAD
jgi:hypothetical protein